MLHVKATDQFRYSLHILKFFEKVISGHFTIYFYYETINILAE